MEKMKFIQFGAGNIGRSFIGRVFGSAGFSVTFIDVNEAVINKLNRESCYEIAIKKNNIPDRLITVSDVSGVLITETEHVNLILTEADLMATSVGKNVLPRIAPVIARALMSRYAVAPDRPLNIILAENLHNGARFFSAELRKHLPEDFPMESYVGLIETSIGKMVPIMPQEVVGKNPTIVYSEEYNTLILDAKAFIGEIPEIADIQPVDNIAAYVDRKLCIHNLGHAAAAYLGNSSYPKAVYLYEVLQDRDIYAQVRRTMVQSATALEAEYPAVFSTDQLKEHIDDLLDRFQNRALGDTIFRIGRDLPRKLYRDDRILGAAGLCLRHGLPLDAIVDVFCKGLHFSATDERGVPFAEDLRFKRSLQSNGLSWVLESICGLDPQERRDRTLLSLLIEHCAS